MSQQDLTARTTEHTPVEKGVLIGNRIAMNGYLYACLCDNERSFSVVFRMSQFDEIVIPSNFAPRLHNFSNIG